VYQPLQPVSPSCNSHSQAAQLMKGSRYTKKMNSASMQRQEVSRIPRSTEIFTSCQEHHYVPLIVIAVSVLLLISPKK
jgi:hypothetical protein